MHNIEPADHASGLEREEKSKQPITKFVRVRGEIRCGGEKKVNILWTAQHSSSVISDWTGEVMNS